MKGLEPKYGQWLLETQPIPTGECQKTFEESSFSKDRHAGSSHDSEKEIPDKEKLDCKVSPLVSTVPIITLNINRTHTVIRGRSLTNKIRMNELQLDTVYKRCLEYKDVGWRQEDGKIKQHNQPWALLA